MRKRKTEKQILERGIAMVERAAVVHNKANVNPFKRFKARNGSGGTRSVGSKMPLKRRGR